MKIQWMITLAAIALPIGVTTPVQAQAQAAGAGSSANAREATQFVQALYRPYAGDPGRAQTEWNRRPELVFEPQLARAFRASLDADDFRAFDPFCLCQDWEPFTADIEPIWIDENRATFRASFTNFGSPMSVDIELIRTAVGWRVYNSPMGRENSLRLQMLGEVAEPIARPGPLSAAGYETCMAGASNTAEYVECGANEIRRLDPLLARAHRAAVAANTGEPLPSLAEIKAVTAEECRARVRAEFGDRPGSAAAVVASRCGVELTRTMLDAMTQFAEQERAR